MSDNPGATCNRDTLLENFAADLTSAVYPLVLRRGLKDSWIKVELSLWRAVAETVMKWAREWPATGSAEEFKGWREGLLLDLTESAFYIAIKHGVKGPLLEVELGLYRALRSVIRRLRREAAAAPGRSA